MDVSENKMDNFQNLLICHSRIGNDYFVFFLGNFYYHPNRLFWPISFYADFLRENFRIYFFNDTHREGLVFHSIQYSNGCLAASDLSPMFTQLSSIHSIISTDV